MLLCWPQRKRRHVGERRHYDRRCQTRKASCTEEDVCRLAPQRRSGETLGNLKRPVDEALKKTVPQLHWTLEAPGGPHRIKMAGGLGVGYPRDRLLCRSNHGPCFFSPIGQTERVSGEARRMDPKHHVRAEAGCEGVTGCPNGR